ncbi:STM4015 family protein [Actinomadura atramentaria]|uniref:STM4015 family protein n=1 Tax=Actinomadura atramentaria TaxID=1990 RepID=UPI000369C81A|nr:STM4015 family protein [Actinomadura atramentaria]
MTFNDHLGTYAGLPVAEFSDVHVPDAGSELPPAAGHAWRVRTDFDGTPFEDVWARFLETVETSAVSALIIGYWGFQDAEPPALTALLTESADRFPNLRSLFVGDIVLEESEVSWIEHGDLTPLFPAFPELERLDVRGAEGLAFEPIKSTALRTLRLETGGLPATVVRSVAASDLPALEHLDLWLGTEAYGGDATAADLAPILSGERLPALRHLGLEDAEDADGIAAAVAGAPVVARLESLSLALGALSDAGAEALLSGQPLTHLKKLDLHHHFLTDVVMDRLRTALPGIDINLDDRFDPDGRRRFIAVSE